MTLPATLSTPTNISRHWLDKAVFPWWPALTIEKLLIILIIAITLLTRFSGLGDRTMSHDEVNHVVPSYTIETYVYDPVTHGPFQFHALALSYFLLGDSDFSARVPAALFGIGVVLFALFAWRRYLGRVGALIAGFLFMISPYILFYSRYTRNEIFIVFWGMVMLWLFLRYLEGGEIKWLYWLTFITAMHFADKATSYIFTAEALIFLALLFIAEALRKDWENGRLKTWFTAGVAVTLLASLALIGVLMLLPGTAEEATGLATQLPKIVFAVLLLAGLAFALYALIKGLGMPRIRLMRSFDLVVLQLLLVLPLLTTIPVKLLGFDPLDYGQMGIIRSSVVFGVLLLLAMFLGMLWNRKVWLRSALIFWGIFIIFYTTFFMHGEGFFKGLVAALGYWMSQQTVQRGTQPLYYYAFVQIPIYEFLPALGAVLSLVIAAARNLFTNVPLQAFLAPPPVRSSDQADKSSPEPAQPMDAVETIASSEPENQPALLESSGIPLLSEDLSTAETFPSEESVKSLGWFARLFALPPHDETLSRSIPTVALLLYWSAMSLLAFSFAGERMPWLATHITMPMILVSGWGLAYLVEKTNWHELRQKRGPLVLLALIVLLFSLAGLFGAVLGATPPFQGKELLQLQATSSFLLAGLGTGASLIALVYLLREWQPKPFLKLIVLTSFAFMSVFTFRAAYRAAFINYDNAKEFLVYAHSTRDMKDVLGQIETISKRLYGDNSINVAYDNDSLYPFWWYLRDYPNRRWFGDSVTKDLQDSPIILVGTANFAKIEPVVANDYYMYTFKRMWWPTEMYRNQTLRSVWDMLKQPAMRAALWEIWFNRDYTAYAAITGETGLTLATWSPADNLRMYIRKDVAAQIWEYGLSPEPEEPRVDPYVSNTISLDPERVISSTGESIFSAPRGLASAPDGSLYVADSRNHRIVHLDETGLFINAWGTYANVLDGLAPEGSFNEPWGVAVSPDGLVYVADTWNHRIQVFSADGKFLRMWSTFSVDGIEDGFWGPRGIAVDTEGHVYVTDTGKQRVVVFDTEGNYIAQFGGRGYAPGELDEPVGIAIDSLGRVYVADTWNNRMQVFEPNADYTRFVSILSWDVDAWNTDTLDNKPFIALNAANDVFITDPDLGRVIRFDAQGSFQQLWGGYQNNYLMGITSGITVGSDGIVWVSDALNNTVMAFRPPALP